MFKKQYILLPAILFLVALLPSQVNAAKFHVGDYTLDKQEIVEEDLYVAGDSITINGVVDGDVIASGNTVTIDGTVTGDVYTAGSTLKLSGNIYGNIIAAGSSLNISGTLGENVIVAGSTINVSGDVSQDVLAAGMSIDLEGNVGDDVRVAGSNITSKSKVGGDFVVTAANYNVDDNDVAGELVTKETEPFLKGEDIDWNFEYFKPFNIDLGFSFIGFLGMFLVGVAFIFLAPVKTVQFEEKINGSWMEVLKSFAIGLLILFVAPLPLVLLTITLVGAPLALLITGLLLFLITFGTLWTEIAIGHTILDLVKVKDSQRYLSLLVGRIVTVLVKFIPVVRFFYSMTLMMLTVGAVARAKVDAYTKKSTTKTAKKSK